MEKSEDCTNPNCTICDPQADGAPGWHQYYMGAQDAEAVFSP
jgi:hypothetical protein